MAKGVRGGGRKEGWTEGTEEGIKRKGNCKGREVGLPQRMLRAEPDHP